MQRLTGWVRYAADRLPAAARGGAPAAAGQPQDSGGGDDDGPAIYGRIAVHSDDEEPGFHGNSGGAHHHHHHHGASAGESGGGGGGGPRRASAPDPAQRLSRPDSLTASPTAAAARHHQHQQNRHSDSRSDGELERHGSRALQQQQLVDGPDLIQLDSDVAGGGAAAGGGAVGGVAVGGRSGSGWSVDWGEGQKQGLGAATGTAAAAGAGGGGSAVGAGDEPPGAAAAAAGGHHHQLDAAALAAARASMPPELAAAAAQEEEAAAARRRRRGGSGKDGDNDDGHEAAAAAAAADDNDGEVEDDEDADGHDHAAVRRELLIYAIPLQRGSVVFLPVCPWRDEPPPPPPTATAPASASSSAAGSGGARLGAAVVNQVRRVQGDAASRAADVWSRMAAAEEGTAAHRLYKLGRRLLESVPAEERLMRGVPSRISRVVIHHPTEVGPDVISQQMATMTKSYGVKAVGRAAAATLMLPLALGVDLIILPGPQVLTYYTLWQLARNAGGAVGTSRMTRFVTQSGGAGNIRVCYVADGRLDKYRELSADAPEGVLGEEDIEGLVGELREPDLREPLVSLRRKALRDLGRRTSRGGDEYTALPGLDPAAGGAAGGAASSSSFSAAAGGAGGRGGGGIGGGLS